MNQDAFINKLAHVTGGTRKQVLNALKAMSQMPEVKNKLKKSHDKKG